MDDEDPDVRLWAAAHVLTWDPVPAERTLRVLAEDPIIDAEVALSANVPLEEFAADELVMDWKPVK